MSEKTEEIEKKEVEENVGTTSEKRERGSRDGGSGEAGNGGTDGTIGGAVGRTEGTVGGEDSSSNEREQGNSTGSSGNTETDRKSKLLERIRQRNKKSSDAASSEYEGNQRIADGGTSTNDLRDNGNEGFDGNSSGRSGDVGRDNSSTTKNNASPVNRSRKNARNNNSEVIEGDEIGGVKFDASEFKFAPQKPVEKPKNQGDVLNKKEAIEMQSKLNEILRMVFTYSDRGISSTVKGNVQQVQIWSSITDSELSVISKAIVETGMTNKAVANGIRTMAVQHNKVLIGVVMIPRFIQTAQLYIKNGFEMPKMGGLRV